MLLFVRLKMCYDIISRTKGHSVSWWTSFHRLNTDVESEKFGVKTLYMVMKMLLCLYPDFLQTAQNIHVGLDLYKN